MEQNSGPELAPVIVITWSIGEVRIDEDSFIISLSVLVCSPKLFSHYILIVSDSISSVEIVMIVFSAKNDFHGMYYQKDYNKLNA